MVDISKYKVGIGFAALCVFILIIAVVLSIRSYFSSKELEARFASTLRALQHNVGHLESRIEAFEELARENQASIQSFSGIPDESKKAGLGLSKDNTKNEQSGNKQDQQNLFAAMENMDQEVLKEMYKKAVREKLINTQQDTLREINLEQRETDEALYSEAVGELLMRTRPRRPDNDLGSKDREDALDELLDKYPDSYAAAKAVSNEVIDSLRKNDIQRAEGNYNLLVDLQSTKDDSVVLDFGVEAVPQMSNALAHAYLRNGMTDKIGPIVENLEANYADSLIRLRFPRGRSNVVTGQEAVGYMRRISGIE